MSAQDVLSRLAAVTGIEPEGSGRLHRARCPAHDDADLSLGISQSEDRINLNCSAGCATQGVLDKIGMTWSDLDDSIAFEVDGRAEGASAQAKAVGEPFADAVIAPDEVIVRLTADEARALTDKIKADADRLYVRVREAQRRRAWEALDYRSFEDYVRQEFGYGRRAAFYALRRGTLTEEIAAAAGIECTAVHLSAAAARRIESDQVVEAVRRRVAEGDDPLRAVDDEIARSDEESKRRQAGRKQSDTASSPGESVEAPPRAAAISNYDGVALTTAALAAATALAGVTAAGLAALAEKDRTVLEEMIVDLDQARRCLDQTMDLAKAALGST